MKVKRTLITKDIKLSPRIDTGVNADVVEDYAACYDRLPAIVVFKLPDKANYVLVDGWHRLTAAERLDLDMVDAEVRYGSLDEAKEYALLANLRHGQPLTRKEKRHVIEEFLKLHPERSNNWIAEDLGISKATVANCRETLEQRCQIDTFAQLVGKDGVERPRTIQQPKREEPEAVSTEQEPESEPEPEPSVASPVHPYALNEAHQVDCVVALMTLPEASIDLVFTDPRYNLGKSYGSGSNDALPEDEYYRWCMQWFMGVFRVLKPGGAFYVMHYPEVAAQWKQQLDTMFTFQRWLTWVYPQNVGHSKNNWTRAQRAILYYVKGEEPAYFDGLADPQPYRNPDDMRIKHRGQKGVTPYDWWEYDLVKNVSKDKTPWPNQLPVDLVSRIVATSCPPDGVVCDPSMGSGTTAEAAVRAGRAWIGFDIESKACELTTERVARIGSSS